MAEPITTGKLAEWRADHFRRSGKRGDWCNRCGHDWPCPMAALLDEVERLQAGSFAEFQEMNRLRCEEGFGHAVAWDEPSWPLQNWALAIAGEAGELCNLVKKCLRGDFTVTEKRGEILNELADVMTYCDLAISALGASTSEALWEKFAMVSKRIGWEVQP